MSAEREEIVVNTDCLDAENLSRFAMGVRDGVRQHAAVARELPGQVRSMLVSLGVEEREAAKAPRYVTARAVAELVEALQAAGDRGDNELVRAIAGARLETTAPAMGVSFKSAARVGEALRGADWDILRAVKDLDDGRREKAQGILGLDIKGHIVHKVLVTEASDIETEYYVSYLLDRANRSYLAMCSAEGGMEIEQLAVERPEALARIAVDPVEGVDEKKAREIAEAGKIPAQRSGQARQAAGGRAAGAMAAEGSST